MIMKQPDAILFDWDNTLADTWPIIYGAMSQTFVDMGHEPWSFEETKLRVHRSMRDAFPDIFGEKWEEAASLYQAHYKSKHLEALQALPMAQDILEFLKPQDIFIAVVSNKRGENLRKEIKHMEWEHYFSSIVGATDAEEDKPSTAPVNMALNGSGITLGKNVWFVGDSITDMECAHNSGCLPLFYGDDDPLAERYQHCRPVKHLKNHDELMRLLKEVTDLG